jgi:hypothetical protein
MATAICSVTDHEGRSVAEIEIQSVEDGWHYGRLVRDTMPDGLCRDLQWYDEVVSGQMLSYLDDALAGVDRHQLSVRLPDETCHQVYSLHIGKSGEASFRITPVPPPEPNHSEVSSILS